MSDNFAPSYNDNDGVTKQAVHSRHQSGWMSHWMSSTSCKSTTKQACGQLSICYESQVEENRDPKDHRSLDAPEKESEDEQRTCEIAESRSVAIMDESTMVKSDKLKSSFPMFNLQRRGDNDLAQKIEQPSSSHWGNLKPQTDGDSGYQLLSLGGGEKHLRDLPPMVQWLHDAKNPSRENPSKPDCILEIPEGEPIVEDNKLATEKSIKGDLVVSSSKFMPYGFNFGKTLVRSMGKQEEINQLNSIRESGERVTDAVFHKKSMFLVCEDSVNNLFGRSRNPLARHNDADLLPRDPSTSRSQQPEFVATQYHKIQEHAGKGLFKSENNPIELTKLENLYRGNFSLPSLQGPLHGMDTMTACTEAMEESSKGRKIFSTSHHFLFTKSDFNLMEGRPILKDSILSTKDSILSTKLKEKYSPELFRFDQVDAFPVKNGVKLQLLGSSTGSEEEKDAKDFMNTSFNMRNETSSETNTMDLDTFRKNYVSGAVSSSSNKQIELDQRSLMSQAALYPSREVGGRLEKAKLPDINHLPNDLIDHANSTDSSTSRTQSLDAEHLLPNAEQPENLKRNARPASGCLESEPSRWVKRLKLNSTSACGTQSSKMGEASHEKVNTFSKIMKFSSTSLDPITGHSCGKAAMGFDKGATLWNGKSPSIEFVRKNREVALSHPWIRRLCRNSVSSQEQSKTTIVPEPQLSKASMDKHQKNQFPTLAAMALMGKGMGGFHSCHFTRKGSSVVWDS